MSRVLVNVWTANNVSTLDSPQDLFFEIIIFYFHLKALSVQYHFKQVMCVLVCAYPNIYCAV